MNGARVWCGRMVGEVNNIDGERQTERERRRRRASGGACEDEFTPVFLRIIGVNSLTCEDNK